MTDDILKPYHAEWVDRKSLPNRLRLIEATFYRKYGNRYVYQSGPLNAWISVDPIKGRYLFSLYHTCPCQNPDEDGM
jgi:hypothetical protein